MGSICGREESSEPKEKYQASTKSNVTSSPSLEINAISSSDVDKSRRLFLVTWKDISVKEPPNEFSSGPDQSTETRVPVKTVDASKFTGSTDERVTAWAKQHVDRMRTVLNEVFDLKKGFDAEVSEKLEARLRGAVNDNLAPVVEDLDSFSDGLAKMSNAFFDKYKAWILSKQQKITEGLPTVIVDALKTGLDRSRMLTVPQQIKTAIESNLKGISGDLKSHGKKLAEAMEAVTTFVWRRCEVELVQDFISEAARYDKEADEGGGAIHKDGKRFDAWLKRITSRIPMIAAWTFHTGVVGDKLRFLQCYNGVHETVSESDFFFAESYLDDVVSRTVQHTKKIDMIFTSSDPDVQGKLAPPAT